MITLERNTKETRIKLTLDPTQVKAPEIATGVPFFDHLLTAMSFHGGFFLKVEAEGDLEVDPHHLVEDVGLVLGMAFKQYQDGLRSFARFGHAVIPMDEALSEVTIDVCGRPSTVYSAAYPQTHAGVFDLSLLREFLIGMAAKAQIALHAACRYGENGHHMAESLFKALGKALSQAYSGRLGDAPSTKGSV